MALSGFGQRPTAGGKARAWHKAKPEAAMANRGKVRPSKKPQPGQQPGWGKAWETTEALLSAS